jgi:hypothetical protein
LWMWGFNVLPLVPEDGLDQKPFDHDDLFGGDTEGWYCNPNPEESNTPH